ncbi:MAG: ATP-binding cassette domain-containing protein [Bacteroidales bacterium]|jgi:cell division transport system ATP-binding protein|nr:ATP-binding cassette domain-containing protein [Bacteroidales bacterium]
MQNNDVLINLESISIGRDGEDFLTDITFTLNKGEFVYLVGKTGSGKSTFLKGLYSDIDVKGNKASVLGFDLLNIKHREIPFLRRELGIVFQDFQLLPDRDIEKNLEFAMKSTGWTDKKLMTERAETVLNLVGLYNKRDKKPASLSDGEKQRVAIARAILNSPKLILADEPTGSLDPETSEEIMKVLMNINEQGTAVLMATHVYSLFRKFPGKILKCVDGKIFYADFSL